MNILLINHYAGSPRHGMEFRPYYLAREWVRMGHSVQIIAGAFSHVRAQQPQLQSGHQLDENIDGIGYRWYSMGRYIGNGVGRVRSMLQFLWHLWRDGARLANEFKPDVVIASSTYPMDIWPARRIAKMSGAKLVFEVHDLWPLSPMELGGMPKWHPFIMWVQWAEDYAYRHADKVVSILPKALPHMQSRGLAPQKFVAIPNGVVEAEWSAPTPLPLDVREHIARLKATGQHIVAYVGAHGLANALDVLLDAAQALNGKVQILMVGPGPERQRLFARVQREGLTNVTMLPSVPKRSVPSLLAEIDIAYIGLLPESLFRFGISPNKLMDYMMASKPIVCAISAGNDPVVEAHCGITVAPGDSNAVTLAILNLVSRSFEELTQMGKNGRVFVLKNQTYSVLARQFLSAIGD